MYDDDDFGDDEFGLSERKVARLLKRKAKLEAAFSVVGPARQKAIAKRLQRINRVLEEAGMTGAAQMSADALAASGIEGVGGLMFQAQSPPGLGRLVRLPFYPSNVTGSAGAAGTITAAGAGVSSTINPVTIFRPALVNVAATSAGVQLMRTPQVSWATLRIVGFESQQRQFKGIADTGAKMVVSDLQIGGGANLFTHEDFADAAIYDADQPEFAGLRDYPILRSPNVAEVVVQQVGNLTANEITWTCALLCEVLIDDNYGAHIPGPYARKGALVRQGGSFV